MGAPEYLRIVNVIKNKIMREEIKPGEAIQSENHLCEEFNLSRMTVRKGLAVLVNEGYIYSIRGKGNYVCEPNLDAYTLHFDEMMAYEQRGEEIKLIEVNVIKPNDDVRSNLKISENKHVVVIKRVFVKDGNARAFDVKYIPYYRGIPIVEKEIRYATFPEIVAKKNSIFAMTKKLTFKVAAAKGEVSAVLGIKENAPVLIVEQKLLNDKGRPIGWGLVYFTEENAVLEAVASFD